MQSGEIEHGTLIAENAEAVWNWTSAAGRRRAERRAELIVRSAGLAHDTCALELGCGTGVFTRTFAETGCPIVAVDVSAALLERARSKITGHRVTFCLGDAERLCFDDSSFDVVIGSSILHHLDVARTLSEIHRVLKPNGRMAFAEPNMLNPHVALLKKVPLFRRWAGESPEETAFFRWRLASQIRAAGFAAARIEPFDFLHPVVPGPLVGIVSGLGSRLERLPGVREIAGSLLISAARDGGTCLAPRTNSARSRHTVST